MANTTTDLLSITVLPNGKVDSVPEGAKYNVGDLRVSIVLTPSLAEKDSSGNPRTLNDSAFGSWPEIVRNMQWNVFVGATPCACAYPDFSIPGNIQTLWSNIFGSAPSGQGAWRQRNDGELMVDNA